MSETKLKEELVFIPVEALDKIFKLGGRLNSIACGLYIIYLIEAAKQKTNRIRCANNYAAKRLKLNVNTIRKYKNLLIKLGLISTTQKRGERGGFGKSYIKIKKYSK